MFLIVEADQVTGFFPQEIFVAIEITEDLVDQVESALNEIGEFNDIRRYENPKHDFSVHLSNVKYRLYVQVLSESMPKITIAREIPSSLRVSRHYMSLNEEIKVNRLERLSFVLSADYGENSIRLELDAQKIIDAARQFKSL